MHVVLIQIHVKPECLEAFKAATLANVAASVLEAGIARFDFHQLQDDPCRFMLYEAYRGAEAVVAHKDTAHYKLWRDTVADMMATPRSSTKLTCLAPAGVW